MKVLLDENVPETLTSAFDRHETLHVNALSWQLVVRADASTAQKSRLQKWLGQPDS